MDTKALLVGQDVYMLSGCYIDKGKVVKITPDGVDVLVYVGCATWTSDVGREHVLHFDKDGKERDDKGTYECGPWQLDDMPFAERTALLRGR